MWNTTRTIHLNQSRKPFGVSPHGMMPFSLTNQPYSSRGRLAGDLSEIKPWLDDIRPCPAGYTHARSVNEAIKLLEPKHH